MKSVQLSPEDHARLRRSHAVLTARAQMHRAEHGEDHDYNALVALADWSITPPVAVIDMKEAMRPYGGLDAPMSDRTAPAVAYFIENRAEIDALFCRPMTNLLVYTGTGVLHQLVSGRLPQGQVVTTLLGDDDGGGDYVCSVHLDTTGPKADIRSAVFCLSTGEQVAMSAEEDYENTGRMLSIHMAASNWIHRCAVELEAAESASVH